MPKPTALITGAGGFIGTHLTGRLMDLGWQTHALTRADGELSRILVERPEVLDQDVIFHLAGTASVPLSISDPQDDLANNTLLTLQLLDAVRLRPKKAKIVYLSSAAVYGDPVKMPIGEDDAKAPLSPYGVSKLASESYMRIYSQLHAVPTVVLRPFSVYGPGQNKLVIYDLLKQLAVPGTKLEVMGDGLQMRDFVHVSDLVAAMILAAEKAPANGEAYNVASGKSVTIAQLATLLIEVTNQQRQLVFSHAVRPGEPLRWQVDISKLAALGFAPKVDLREGLRSLAWHVMTGSGVNYAPITP